MNYPGNLGIRVVMKKGVEMKQKVTSIAINVHRIFPFPPTSWIPPPLNTIWKNLFITICKSKKVKLVSISCGTIPDTDSGLGLIFSSQKCSSKHKKYYIQYLLIMDQVCFQLIKDSRDMNRICDLKYTVVHSWQHIFSSCCIYEPLHVPL